MPAPLGTVALLSLEPWDDVWRRNQHLAVRLVRLGFVERIWFVSPASKLRFTPPDRPMDRLRVTTPIRLLPHHRGAVQQIRFQLLLQGIRKADVLWINDATLGSRLLTAGQPTLYDVTDDWRSAKRSPADRRDLIRSEDRLATRATTVVCSQVLADRWEQRYGVHADIIQNGVDVASHRDAPRITLPGPGPHAVYVGTLHEDRLDVDLVVTLANEAPVTIHLIGPDCLTQSSRTRLRELSNVYVHPPVPHVRVPSVLASADVLLCPHIVDDFTLSLDAIKSFEYAASGRPVVATASSGFQAMPSSHALQVVSSDSFVQAVCDVLRRSPELAKTAPQLTGIDWDDRAVVFARHLADAKRH